MVIEKLLFPEAVAVEFLNLMSFIAFSRSVKVVKGLVLNILIFPVLISKTPTPIDGLVPL